MKQKELLTLMACSNATGAHDPLLNVDRAITKRLHNKINIGPCARIHYFCVCTMFIHVHLQLHNDPRRDKECSIDSRLDDPIRILKGVKIMLVLSVCKGSISPASTLFRQSFKNCHHTFIVGTSTRSTLHCILSYAEAFKVD